MELTKDTIKKYNWIPLVVVIILGFLLVNPLFFKNQLEHPSPQGYLASDAYWHAAYTLSVIKNGFYNQEPGFATGFNPYKITPVEPPLVLYVGAITNYLFNIPYYDSSVLTLFLLLVSGLFALYLLSAKIDPILPYFSIPASLFLFIFPFSAAISWGFWKFLFGGLLLFSTLVAFFTLERNWKSAILIAFLFAATVMAHPSMGLFFIFLMVFSYVYEIMTDKSRRTKENFTHYATIGITGILICLNYLLDFYASRLSGDSQQGRSLIESITTPGYNIGIATPQISHLGVFWWLALLGVIAALFLKKYNNANEKTMVACFSLIFLIFLGPVIGYDRIYQFRLLWPLFIAMFTGIFFMVLLHLVKLKESQRYLAIVILSLVILLYIFWPQRSTIHDDGRTYSLSEDSYWEAIQLLSKADGSKVFVIDPVLTQHAVVLNINQYTRILMEDDARSNKTVLTWSKMECIRPPFIRTGFFSFEKNTISDLYCGSGPVDPCQFDFFLVHARVADESQKQWLTNQLAILQNRLNITAVWQKEATLIIKNNEVCRK